LNVGCVLKKQFTEKAAGIGGAEPGVIKLGITHENFANALSMPLFVLDALKVYAVSFVGFGITKGDTALGMATTPGSFCANEGEVLL